MSVEQRTSRGTNGVLAACRAGGRAALIGYLPVGYPDVPTSIRAMETLCDNGIDIVEVGMPYSDPLMDGAVIQRAATQALERGVHVEDVFRATAAVRAKGVPPLVMSYWNLVLRRGVARYAADLAAAGGAGLITPDLIPDEAQDWIEASEAQGLDRVFLVAPSSTPERLAIVTEATRGFVYAASTMGVTGARSSVGDAAADLVARTREHTELPVCVGLGVSTREQAAEIASYADGVIVGSALVACLDDPDTDAGLERLAALTRELAAGVREPRR